MTTYYVVNPWSVNTPDAGNTGGFPQVAAGTFTPQDGDVYILDGSLACSIAFTGNATFSVDVPQSLTAGAHVGGMNVSFLCGTNATVNVASGVDADFANLLASNNSLTVNLGDNVKIGGVFAAVCDQLIVEGGDNVSINSTMVGSWKNSSVILGDDANLNGVLSFDASGTYLVADSQTFIVGDNAEFRFGIAMNGSYSNNTFVTGENATITGTVGMSGSGNNASATINIGDGSTITGDVIANGSLLNVDIDLGNSVTVRNIHMNGSYIDGNIKVGADSVVTGVYASGSYSNLCIGLADGTSVSTHIVMNGSLNSQSLTLGDDVSVAFSISMGGSRNIQSLDLGDGVFVGQYVLQSGGLNVNHSVVGDNFVLGLAWVGSSSGSEYVEIGNNWRIGQYLSLQGGDDSLILGSAASGVNARILGSCGFDSISVTPPAGQEAAFATAALAAGWTQAADGTWGSNGRTLTFAGVTYSEFEGAGVEHEEWDVTCPSNGVVDGTFGNDLMQIGYTDDQGDQIDGTDGLNDRIQAYNGDDTISAGLGNDSAYGGSGNDSVSGDAGNDMLYGGTGNDTLSGGDGNDQLFGGNGNDQVTVGGGDIALGGAGNDTFSLATGEAAGNIDIVINGGSNGAGGDVLNTSPVGAAQTIVLATGGNSGAINGLDGDTSSDLSFVGIESVITGAGNDLVLGGGEGSSIAINTGAGTDKVVHSFNPTAALTGSYNGGAGTDTFVLAFTAAHWATPAAQAEVAAYLAHLNVGNASVPFTFNTIKTTVTNFEIFEVTVNGVTLNPANASVTANNDAIAYTENAANPPAIDLLLNDVVPDRAASVQMLTGSSYGSLTLATSLLATTQTANLVFVPDNAVLQSLREGEVVVETLTYRVTDVDGSVGDATVTISITGTNDLATITGVATGSTTEDAFTAIAGTLIVSDVDTGEAAFQTPVSLTGTYGTFTFNPATGAWAYTATQNPALQSLAVGTQVSDQITVTSLDGTASQTITVTITGTNDAPTLQAAVLGAQEDGPAVTLNLATLGDDVDSDNDGTDLTYTITGAPSVGTASITGTTLSYTAGTAFQNLAQGETATQEIEVTATDRNGAAVISTVTVTLTGTNDAPEIVMQPGNAPTITDLGNGQFEVSGTVQFTDADFSNTHFVTALDPLGVGVTITPISSAQNGAVGEVSWSYLIDADDFVAGSDQTITLFVNDQFGAADQVDVTFTVPDTGNSLPDVSTPITVFNIVGEGVTAVDIVNFYFDTDGDPLTALADPLQQYPGISFTGTGLFFLNCDDPAYQFLIDGQTQTFSYTYLVSDGTGNAVATLEWTIQGSREGIVGTAGADDLVGDDGESELLNGGAGDDSLTGGAGDDIFAYLAAGDGFDLITDFVQLEDRIGVSASALGGNLQAGTAPIVLNTTDYTSLDSGGTDGVFIFQEDFTGGTLYWDANGGLGDDAIAIAQLTNVTTLSADDFFLFI